MPKAFGAISPDSTYVLFDIVQPYSIQKLDLANRNVTPVLEKAFGLGFARNTNLMTYSIPSETSQGQDIKFLLTRFDGQRLSEPTTFVNITRTRGFVFFQTETRSISHRIAAVPGK